MKVESALEHIRFFYGDPMNMLSSLLRAMIIPSEGKEFVCADYNAVEVRVLFWVAGHEEGCSLFRDGGAIYEDMAGAIFGRPVEEIANPSEERNLGKAAVLGCGFGMGKKKFFQSCKDRGQPVTEELAERAVRAYRSRHAPVVELWGNLERAAIRAVIAHQQGRRGTKYRINKTTWFVEGRFLFCELPSGRRLAYCDPSIRYEETPWGEPRPVLRYWYVDGLSKKWVEGGTYGGALTENVVQAIARDLMAAAMLRADRNGYELTLSVHDELLAEQDPGRPLEEFEEVMARLPAWAVGCPVKAGGWVGRRYRK